MSLFGDSTHRKHWFVAQVFCGAAPRRTSKMLNKIQRSESREYSPIQAADTRGRFSSFIRRRFCLNDNRSCCVSSSEMTRWVAAFTPAARDGMEEEQLHDERDG